MDEPWLGRSATLQRIVLYVDDLDRCPPEKVVDVLRAVHLLLTLPLFVVVVAVDPWWLRRALEQHHAALFLAGDRSDEGQASPADYLDKIFQIPYVLRPIGDRAGGYIRSLLREAGPAGARSPAATDHFRSSDPPHLLGRRVRFPSANRPHAEALITV